MAPSSSRPLRQRHHPSPLLILLVSVSVLLTSLPISATADGLPELGGGDGLYREILRDETVLRLNELGKISDGEGYLERTFLSPASIRATAVIINWMKDAGLTTWVDQMGNIHGRFEPTNSTKEALLIGSHMDTVIDAGMYDGSLGIICAISALKVLKVTGKLQRLTRPVEGYFVNRMSNEALLELQQLNAIIQDSQLSDQPDTRISVFSRTKDKLDTSAIYRLLKAKGQENDPTSTFIWKNAAPPRVQLFFWLLLKGRIQCRSNLHRKKIVDSPACPVCGADHETPDHIIFQCPIATQFWAAVGLQSSDSLQSSNWHNIQKIRGIPDDQYSAFVTLCCWQLWKRRNAFVFRDDQLNTRQLILSCKTEAHLWRARMPKKSKRVIDEWSKIFDSSVNRIPM